MFAWRRLIGRLDALVHSIRFRLVLWFVAILAVVLTAFSVFVYYNQFRDLRNDALGRLGRRITLIGEMLTLNPAISSGNLLQENELLVVLGPDGSVLASQGPVPAQDVLRLAQRGLQEHPHQGNPPAAFVSWTGVSPENRIDYQFLIAPVVSERGLAGFLILGSPLDPGGQLHRLMLTLLVGSLLTLAVALGGGLWLADRAMHPVKTITHAARQISDTDLSRRLNMHGKDEIGELANTFDAMLTRLQAAFERQRQFVADASHELRTPLTIVNLETDRALAARRSRQEYQRALGMIRAENDFMIRLVNDLLALARMDAGQAPLAQEPLDLSDVALDAMERLLPLAERNGVRLEGGELPEARVLGDRQQLLQMVGNLVENGIKYTTGSDKRVRIETGLADGTAWVRVTDTGPGIAAEHLPHLFDRFYRVDKARGRDPEDESRPGSSGGSGLGLAIVQWIAQAHGGEVRVESMPGVGTTFEARFKAI